MGLNRGLECLRIIIDNLRPAFRSVIAVRFVRKYMRTKLFHHNMKLDR